MPKGKPTKKPISVFCELYDQGVIMRLDEESGRLKAHHVTEDGLTDDERALIKKHVKEFKQFVYWSEPTAKMVIRKMYETTNEKVDVTDEIKQEGRVWEEEINEAYAEANMGRLRWAARRYVEAIFAAARAQEAA